MESTKTRSHKGNKGYGRTKSELAKRRAVMIEMHNSGASWSSISERLGFKSNSTVYSTLTRLGYTPNENQSVLDQNIDDIRTRIAGGETLTSIAKCYGVSLDMIRYFRRRNKIEYPKRAVNSAGNRVLYSEDDAKSMVSDRWPAFEYVNGYKDTETLFNIRCKTCGTLRQAKLHRSHAPLCEACERKRKEAERQEKEQRALAEREEKKRLREIEKKERESLKTAPKIRPKRNCAVCGTETSRRVYCSDQCAKRAYNKRKEIKRRQAISEVMVDREITVHGLFDRDGGKCWLCGEACKWEDRSEVDGTIICGDLYPSIDHVVPLAKGGKHSWNNVKLAHRICNSLKSDRLIV